MTFIEIAGQLMNSDHIGEVMPDSTTLTITYRFEGGRIEKEEFDTAADYQAKLEQLAEL